MSKPYGLYVAPHYIEVTLNYGNATDVLEPAVKLGFDERLFNIECDFTTQIPSKDDRKTQYRLQCRNHGSFPHYALTERNIKDEEIHEKFETIRDALLFFKTAVGPLLHEAPGDGLRFDPQTRTVIDSTLIAPYRCTPQLLPWTRRVFAEWVCDTYPNRKGFLYQAVDLEAPASK